MSGAIVDRGMTPVVQPIVSRVSMANAACFLVCVVPLIFAAANVYAQTLQGVPNTKRKVIDTGLESLAQSYVFIVDPIRWLDDYTIAFNALQTGPDAKLKEALRGVLYDTRTGSSITIVEDGRISCAAGDLVLFVRNNADGKQSEYAHIRADRTAVESIGPRTLSTTGIDPYTCKPRVRASDRGRLESPLREADGYIDRGKVAGGAIEQAILYRTGAPPLELPLRGKDISSPKFIPFLGKYFIGGWQLLSPDGTVSQLPRPRSIENISRLGPGGGGIVRDGIVSGGGTHEHGDLGLYHATDRALERLYSGWVPTASVSPSGCRVAFVGGRSTNFRDRNALKYVNLCDEA